jgi:hypothetical protein
MSHDDTKDLLLLYIQLHEATDLVNDGVGDGVE